MKFKNNYPGKIWAKSDHWFQSYGQKCIKNRLLGTVLEPDQLPGSRLTGFYQLPGSENRNRPIPTWNRTVWQNSSGKGCVIYIY